LRYKCLFYVVENIFSICLIRGSLKDESTPNISWRTH